MINRKIFKKKKSFNLYIFITLLLILLISFYFFINKIYFNENLFIISSYEGNYYIVPDDKGGQKVPNTDKKSLNTNQQILNDSSLNNKNLYYSIQFLVSTDYNEIISMINYYINSDEFIYKKDDFYVIALNTDLGVDYFLLYKNFSTRTEAYNFCIKYVYKIDDCLIINAQNF